MTRHIFALGALLLFTGTMFADGPGPAEPVATSVQKEPIDTVVPKYRAYVTTTANDKFSFILPDNFRLGGDPGHGRLQIVNDEGGCSITFNLLRGVAGDSQDELKAVYREWLTDRYSGGKIKQEFSRPVLGRNALAFDVEWTGGGLHQTTRAVYVMTNAGLLELTITGGTKNFKNALAGFDELAGSLVQSENGKLTVRHITNSGT